MRGTRWGRFGPRALATAIALAGVILAVSFFYAKPREITVAKAAEGVIQQEVRGPGNVRARIMVSVSSKITGLVSGVFADQGDTVTRGQLLAVLENDDLSARVAVGRAFLSAATEEIAASEAALAKAEADLALARSNYDRDAELFREGVISQAALDASTASFRSAESNVRSATASLMARKAQRLSAEQELRYAEAQLEYTRIVAPMDGLITSRRLEAGSTVVPGMPIFQMADPKTLWVATLMDQTLVGRVREGQPAHIRLRSGEALRGTVTRVVREADPVTRELEVDVSFHSMPSRLTIDEEADVTIVVGEERGLIIPSSALVTQDGNPGVYVVNGGRPSFRPVRLGAANSQDVRVVEGVKDGELVAFEPGDMRLQRRVEPQFSAEP